MDDLANDSSDISCSFCVVETSELRWCFSQPRVCGENATGTLSLVANNTSFIEVSGNCMLATAKADLIPMMPSPGVVVDGWSSEVCWMNSFLGKLWEFLP